MSLGRDIVDAIIREHSYQPIAGEVLVIGHQAVNLSRNEVLELMREHHVAAASGITLACQKRTGVKDSTSAAALFELLGVGAVRILADKNADIVHDLALPIPQHLQSSADFIVDSGAVSDVFAPAVAIRNYARMLRPGGRLVAINNLSGHFDPYAILSAVWYLDYFVCNGFDDCKAYILVYLPNGTSNAFCVDIDCLIDPGREVRMFLSPHEMAVVVFAEKGVGSTDHVIPTHVHRRSATESERYRKNLDLIKHNERPHLVRSRGKLADVDVRGGHLFMQSDYTAAAPSLLRHTEVSDSEQQLRRLRSLCVGTGRDGTHSIYELVQNALSGSSRQVMHDYCVREINQAFCDFKEIGDERDEDALKRAVSNCMYECIVGNGYAAILPLFAQQYGRSLKILHLRRADRDACIASLVKHCETFPGEYRYYSASPYAAVKRMAAFHFGEMSKARWDRLPIEDKFGWYYDRTHALLRQHLDLFDDHIEITTESLNDEPTRRTIAEFIGGDV